MVSSSALVGDAAGIREVMCPVEAVGDYILRTGNATWWVLLDGWEDLRSHDSKIDARVRDRGL